MKKYLIVIDMQKDFIDGALGTKEALEAVPRVKNKLEKYKSLGANIIFTRDTHGDDYMNTSEGRHLPVPHCIKGSHGHEIYQGLDTDGATVIDKPSFGFTEWNRYIEDDGELEIELVGVCTDICVVSNALILKALYPEAKISVDPKACAGVTPESHLAALKTMRMCQIEIGA